VPRRIKVFSRIHSALPLFNFGNYGDFGNSGNLVLISAHLRNLRQLGFAFPITAIPRDVGDYGD
jgi:hypothetical protein